MAKVVDELVTLIKHDTHNPGGDEIAFAQYLAERLKTFAPDRLIIDQFPRPAFTTTHSAPTAEAGTGAPDGPPTAFVYAQWGKPQVLINVHLDTVPPNKGWDTNPYDPQVTADRVIGLGTADTKGAMAAVFAAFACVSPRNVAVLFSGDEEAGNTCMVNFLKTEHYQDCPRAIVCEPTGCRVGTKHRGVVAMQAHVTGTGGHSSLADTMPAPLADIARAAVAVHDWGASKANQGPAGFLGMCLNVAKLAGGVAFNVVPQSATLDLSFRPAPGVDSQAVVDELTALLRAQLPSEPAPHIGTALHNPAFATQDLQAFQPLLGPKGRAAFAEPLNLAFWTEAALLVQAGVDAVVWGPGDIAQAHAPNEWVAIAQLQQATEVFVEVLDATS